MIVLHIYGAAVTINVTYLLNKIIAGAEITQLNFGIIHNCFIYKYFISNSDYQIKSLFAVKQQLLVQWWTVDQ